MVAHEHTATGMRFTLNGELARVLKNLVDDLKTERARALARAEAAEALLREAGAVLDCFGACADDWAEMGDNRIVNPERLVWGGTPIFVGNLRAARDLAAKIREHG